MTVSRAMTGAARLVLPSGRATTATTGAGQDGDSAPPVARWCAELELTGGPPRSITPQQGEDRAARILVRLHGDPLGYLDFPQAPTAEAVRQRAWSEFGDRIRSHLSRERLLASAQPGAAVPGSTPDCPVRVEADDLVSVVVCTRNRSEMLPPCLDRLAALSYDGLEILIVDNAPDDDATRNLVTERSRADTRFRYVCEPRPGLSAARNRGVAEARGRFVAFTDDDVAVDPGWIRGLVRGFRDHPGAGCVTGLVATADINNAAEAYFDARSPLWSTRCTEEVFDLSAHQRSSAGYPYAAGIFGTGANFAVAADLLTEVGPFDEALGAGTRTRGGEDLDMFVRVLHAGRSIVYQPAALVWHHHRADEDALRSQMFGYGTGLSAYATKWLLQRSSRWDLLRRVPSGLLRLAEIRADTKQRLTSGASAPNGVRRYELAGIVWGPVLYLQARRIANASRRSS